MNRAYWGRAAAAVLMVLGLFTATSPGAASAASGEAVPLSTGDNSVGQLGSPGLTGRLTPGPVSIPAVVAVASGRDHSYALDAQRRVWAWGANQYGQIGDGSTTNRPTPLLIGLTDVAQVESGHDHGIALTTDGSVWTWGYGGLGELGLGTNANRNVPTKIPSLSGIRAVAAGRDMSFALRTDGTVMGWGSNALGEVGDGTTTRRLSPVPVTGLADVVELAGGRNHTLAITSDGALWAWGDNQFGQLGDGTTSMRSTPVRISAGPFRHVAAGAHHSMGLLADGKVLVWGRGYRNQLGLGSTANRLTPTVVQGVPAAVDIGSGRDSSFAVTGSGDVWAWGANGTGQLGDGTTTSRALPVHLTGVAGIAHVEGGASHSLFMPVVGSAANQPPHAAASAQCSQLSCMFSSAGSSDVDGTIESFAWSFGDGASSTAQNPSHDYQVAGTYGVQLVVTDDDGAAATAALTVSVAPSGPDPIGFRAGAAASSNSTVTRVTVPAGVQAGDALLLFVSTNTQATVTSSPPGWALEGERLDGTDFRTQLYSRVAAAGDAGRQLSIALSAASKTDLTVLAYRGTNGADPVALAASAAEPGTDTRHTTPTVQVNAGSWVVSYWSDKSSATSAWTAPAGQLVRSQSIGSGSGRVTSFATDAGAASPAGAAGGITATADSAAAKATMWSVVLVP